MKTSEYRLGNYILESNKMNIISQIQELDNIIFVNGYFLAYIKPIPLTEQWLKDFGFNDEEDDRYFEIILFKDNVKWSNEERQVYLAIHKKELAYILGYGINWTDEFKNLKYVHQLQNLYFALTGKELVKK